jgi:polyphosphate kinase
MSPTPDAPHIPESRFLNRELSWLAFNQRVLEEALDPSNPLLERVKFFCITHSNLDEFFEVRVAGLRQQVAAGSTDTTPDGLTAHVALPQVRSRIRSQVEQIYACWRDHLVPELGRHGIRFLRVEDLDDSDRAWLESFYREKVHPVLTPLAIDQSHPFPILRNRSLNLVVKLVDHRSGTPEDKLGVIHVPDNLPRLIRLPRSDARQDYILLGRIIGRYLDRLFAGMDLLGHWHIRVTRNGELYFETEETESLLQTIEKELHNRMRGQAVRLEVSHDCPDDVCQSLLVHLALGPEDLYRIDGPLHPGRIISIADGPQKPELRDPPHVAPVAVALGERRNIFDAIRERDILLHHPYQSFETVIDFLETAAADRDVLAIKQTLYRTGGDSRIINALGEAAKSGKQVTAIVELKARFDEHNNIKWARRLEQAGVHVVYGLLGYKIHSKVALVVRAEDGRIRRYVHAATGNYNATTAKFYTDLGLLTCRPDFGEDATQLFNLLTGICQFQPMRRFLVAPFQLHDRMLELIRNEQRNAERGLPARIVAKMNSLVDPATIDALYAASRKGVSIDLIIRGICCLRPGIPGFSDNIRVRSIVDRFLEHSRVFYFENAANPRVFLGSADWMPRNFFSRIEVVFPVEDGTLRERIISEVLEANLADNTRARVLRSDGSYVRADRLPHVAPRRAQVDLVMAARRQAQNDPHAPIAIVATPARTSRGRKSKIPKVVVRRRPEEP